MRRCQASWRAIMSTPQPGRPERAESRRRSVLPWSCAGSGMKEEEEEEERRGGHASATAVSSARERSNTRNSTAVIAACVLPHM